MLESLPQIIIDGLVRDLAQQCEVGYAHLLLLCNFEGRLLDLWLPAIPTLGSAPAEEGCFRCS